MNWSNPRSELSILTGDLNYLGKQKSGISNSGWRKLRDQTLKNRKNTCRYCGGKYTKYMICFHLDENPKNNDKDNMDISCRLCYIATHINYGHIKDLLVCYSSLSQTEILRKTINFIVDNDYVPEPSDLDPNVKKAPISLMELCSVLIENKNILPNELKDYKLFFTNQIDITFTNFICKKSVSMFDDETNSPYMFTDGSEDSVEEDKLNEKYIPLHIPTAQEINCLDKLFDKDNNKLTNSKMKERLKFIEKINKVTTNKVQKSNKDLNQIFPNVFSTKESIS